MKTRRWVFVVLPLSILVLVTATASSRSQAGGGGEEDQDFDQVIRKNARQMIQDGRQIFRFDTFGDEAFWGDTIQLHRAIEGERFGGVGPGVSPKTALAVGLKVDVEALPGKLRSDLRHGRVDLDDPATTLALLNLNAVIGITGFFNPDGSLRSMGIQCALCHSTVDNSFAFGIGQRLDGWPNRDLNVGAIVALAPNLQPVADLLSLGLSPGDPPVDVAKVKEVLNSWGPGKFDAELFMDGKSAATLIPPAFGLAGVNLHTWTGWGSVTHWNAFVANLEMHGKGTFFDPRLNNPKDPNDPNGPKQFPIAAVAGFGNVRNTPDLITSKLAALQFYQLAIPAPKPPKDSFGEAAAERGLVIFNEKADCARCHVPPLFTEPGWNMHTPAEIGIDSFQSDRAPDKRYRTSPLGAIATRDRFAAPANRGRFFHDGRFATLLDVVNHYDSFFNLVLTPQEKSDLIEYLKSL